ncbi:hypothetical protein AAG906_028213 [Vitis piasezkii]
MQRVMCKEESRVMPTELEELVGFLCSFSTSKFIILNFVKKAAVDIVQGLTGSEDGLQSLCSHSDVLIPSLSRVLSEKKEVSEPAAEALINLSQKPEQAAKMVAMGMIKTAMDILYKQGSGITRLLVMLLVNLTQSDDGIASLLQTGDEKIQGLYLMKLVRSFCTSSTETTDDPFEHVGSILVNISKKDSGRKMLLDPKRGMLKQIVRQFDSTNPLRKKGVSGTIRNCCFEAETQLENLLLISEFLWPTLLLPVAGSKLGSALSIEREPVGDPEIRVQALESLYLISLQVKLITYSSSFPHIVHIKSIAHVSLAMNEFKSRSRALWSVNGPRILQVGYEDEEDPKVMEAFEQVGSLYSVDIDKRTSGWKP